MRTILKHFLINTIALYLISQAISGINFAEGSYTLLLAGVVLTLTTMIIRPIINILLLPINLITFGFFKWIGYAITLYLVTLIVPAFKLGDFVFKGYNSYWFAVPGIHLGGIFAFIAFSFVISTISSIIYWIFK